MSRPRQMAQVVNYYKTLPSEGRKKKKPYKNYDKYMITLPLRALVVGSAGTGKTSLVLNMVDGMNCFSRVFLFVKNPEEKLYARLRELYEKAGEKVGRELITVSNNLDDLPDIDEMSADDGEHKLIIFDDLINEKSKELDKVANYFTRGRHKGLSCIFVSQSWYATPKKIRSNISLAFFKQLSQRDLRLVLSEFASDRTVDELQTMYQACDTSVIENCFTIDQSPGQDPEYRYRFGFTPLSWIV